MSRALALVIALPLLFAAAAAALRLPAPPSPGLSELAARSERFPLMGAAMSVEGALNASLLAFARSQYAVTTPENCMKWAPTEPSPGRFNFTDADAFVGAVAASGGLVRAHNLVWHRELPAWLCSSYAENGTVCDASPLSTAALREALERHVRVVAARYCDPGRVAAWDVVNEALRDEAPFGVRTANVWGARLGPGYVAAAFEAAAKACEGVPLFYNDYNIHDTADGGKGNSSLALLRSLLDAGVRVDGVGMQMHVEVLDDGTAPWPAAGVADSIRAYADLGLAVHVTEMDVRTAALAGNMTVPERLQVQALVYADVLEACAQVNAERAAAGARPPCEVLETWGFTDARTWLAPDELPLPFDAELRPKPAFFAMQSVLSNKTAHVY